MRCGEVCLTQRCPGLMNHTVQLSCGPVSLHSSVRRRHGLPTCTSDDGLGPSSLHSSRGAYAIDRARSRAAPIGHPLTYYASSVLMLMPLCMRHQSTKNGAWCPLLASRSLSSVKHSPPWPLFVFPFLLSTPSSAPGACGVRIAKSHRVGAVRPATRLFA